MLKRIAIVTAFAVLGATVPTLAANNPIIPQSVSLKSMTHAKAAHIVARGIPMAEPYMVTMAIPYYNGGLVQQSPQLPMIQPGFMEQRM